MTSNPPAAFTIIGIRSSVEILIGLHCGSLFVIPPRRYVRNDLLWLIIMLGVKVRCMLKKWNYISYDRCAFCRNPETIEHCFFECRRWERVWEHFHPVLLRLSPIPLTFKDLIFLTGSPTDPRSILVSFVVKTVLYSNLVLAQPRYLQHQPR